MNKETLLSLAKEAIEESFSEKPLPPKESLEGFDEKGAAFVTLTIDGELRGCIGSLIAHRDLYEDVVHNAKAAAFEDPRFRPLSYGEFQKTHIEVSLLSQPKQLLYSDVEDLREKIRPMIDGVILRKNSYQSTFLPQVWEQLPSFDLFFSHLCQKAGLSYDCLKSHPDIYVYEVTKYE